MSAVRLRCAPFSFDFPELNVRTYVTADGKPGVWFFSLDAAHRLAVRAARMVNLPYYDAEMKLKMVGERIDYQSRRLPEAGAAFEASYRPTSAPYQAARDSFDHWLIERYCLYAALRSHKVVYGDIHHPPWRLQRAEAEIRINTMTRPLGVTLPDIAPVCHFARYQEVIAWPIGKLHRG